MAQNLKKFSLNGYFEWRSDLKLGRQASRTSAKLSNFCKFVAELIVLFHTILGMNSQRSQLLTSQLWLAQIGPKFHVFWKILPLSHLC